MNLSGCQWSRALCGPFISCSLVPKEAQSGRLNIAIGNSAISLLGSLRRTGCPGQLLIFTLPICTITSIIISVSDIATGYQRVYMTLPRSFYSRHQYKEFISCLEMSLSSMSASCLLGWSVGLTNSLGRLFTPSVLKEAVTTCFNLFLDATQTYQLFFNLPDFILCLLMYDILLLTYYHYLVWVWF